MITKWLELNDALLSELYGKSVCSYYLGLSRLFELGYSSSSFLYCEDEVIDFVAERHPVFLSKFIDSGTGVLDLSVLRFRYVLGNEEPSEFRDVLSEWYRVLISEYRMSYIEKASGLRKKSRSYGNFRVDYATDGGMKYYGDLDVFDPFLLECAGFTGWRYVSLSEILVRAITGQMGFADVCVSDFVSSDDALRLVLKGALVESELVHGTAFGEYIRGMLRKNEYYLEEIWDLVRTEYLGEVHGVDYLLLSDMGYYVSDLNMPADVVDLSETDVEARAFDVVCGCWVESSEGFCGCYMPLDAFEDYEGFVVRIAGVSYIPMRNISALVIYDYIGLQNYVDGEGVC